MEATLSDLTDDEKLSLSGKAFKLRFRPKLGVVGSRGGGGGGGGASRPGAGALERRGDVVAMGDCNEREQRLRPRRASS